MSRAFAALVIAMAIGAGVPVLAAPLDGAAVDAAPQRYVMTLPPAPVGEIAEEVLGQTLGLPVTTDERVTASMGFRVDGVYTPRELARELGYRLWNVDVALVETSAGELELLPAAALGEAVGAGAQVVAPLALQPQPASAPSRPRVPARYGADRRRVGWGATLIALVGGWGLGVGSAVLWSWRRRRPDAAAPLILPPPVMPPSETGDPDFVLPTMAELPPQREEAGAASGKGERP